MKKIKEFFGKLFTNRVLVLPLIVGICLFAVVNFCVLKKDGESKPNDNKTPVNIEEVIIYPDRANPSMFTYDRVSGGCIISGIKDSVQIDKYAFVILPETTASGRVLGIADEAFKNTAIKGVVIPSCVKTIGSSAFENCTQLKSVKFLSKSENELASITIGENAFKDCVKLKEVTLSNAINEISDSAFLNTNIETLILENNKCYLAVTDNGALGGAVSSGTSILTLAEQNGEVIDDGSNDYLKYFYNLSERVVNNVTYMEYTLKGDIITINLNLSGGELASGVAGEIYRTKISFVKVIDNSGVTRLKVLSDDGKLVTLTDETISLPVVDKLGYWFKEWRTDEGVVYSKIDQNVNEDITLNAVFLPRLIFINYELNGGTNDSRNLSEASENVSYRTGGDARTLYPATKDYSLFAGWYIDSEFKNKIEVINDDIFKFITYSDSGKSESEIETKKTITLYAKFETILTVNSGVVTGVNSVAYNLTEIIIPQSVNGVNVTSIADGALSGLYNLRELTINARLSSIGNNAFKNCYMLTTINYSGAGLFSIGTSAFENCLQLSSFTISSSVISVGKNAFKGCVNLKSVEFESGSLITKIEEGTFSGCRALETVKLPSGAVEFGEYSFFNCEKLANDTFKNTTFKSLGDSCFSGMKLLKKVTLDGTLESFGVGVFKDCVGLEEVVFANGFNLSTIPNSSFSGATSLKTIVLPESVKVIENDAFFNCTGLTSVVFGSVLTTIGNNSFKNTAITEISLPKTCVTIGENAFKGCALKNVEVENVNGWLNNGTFQEFENKYDFLKSIKTGVSLTYTKPFNVDENGYIESINANYPLYIIGKDIKGVTAGAFNENSKFRLLFENESGWFSESVELVINNANGNAEIIELLKTSSIMNEEPLVIENGVVIGSTSAINKITTLIIPEGVTEIKSGAISGSSTITKIVLPSTLLKIEVGAIKNIENLEKVEFVDELYWQNNGSYEDLTDSGKNAQLVQTIKNDLVKMEMFEFVGKELVGLTAVGKSMGELIVPNFVETIGSYAFDGCIATKITIGSGVKEFKDYAFVGATNLTEVKFADECAILTIGNSCFKGLSCLTSFTVPSSVINLGTGVFEECGLTEVDLGGLKYIPDETFKNCQKLQVVLGVQNVKSIGVKAFIFCSSLQSFDFADSVETISDHAFYGCVLLKQLNLNEGLLSIGANAFNGCENLEGVLTLPNSVREVGESCFANCFSLTTLIFGDDIEKIGAYLLFNNDGSERGVTSVIINNSIVFSLCDRDSGIVLEEGIVIGEGKFVSGGDLAHCFKKSLYNYVWIRQK